MAAPTELHDFCLKIPKLEIHAHINGSLSDSTIQKLMDKKKQEKHDVDFTKFQTIIHEGEQLTLDDCFAKFRLVQKLTDNTDAMYLATCDVISDFANEGVKYLELRSTPRDCPSTGMTRRSYVEAVLRAMKDSMKNLDIIVKFILAIDMRNSIEVAEMTVDLALEFMKSSDGVVVGVDFSGDPTAGDTRTFIPTFRRIKKLGLVLALHLGEVLDKNEETLDALQVMPDRVGHGTYFHPDDGGSQEIVAFMLRHKIPLELCLTSNLKAKTVASYDQHHLKFWYEKRHPIAICTDDKGVFCTSLSKEYAIAASTFQLTKEEIWDVSFKTIDMTFADKETKEKLRERWNVMKKDLL